LIDGKGYQIFVCQGDCVTIQSVAAYKPDLAVGQSSGCDSLGIGKKSTVRKGVNRNPALLLPHSSPLSTSTFSWKVIASVFERGSVAH